ncbi:MAG: PilN domain-containing protein [Planctomycetota bacterium]
MINLDLKSKKEGPSVNDASFLPEDYIQRRNELRTNVLSVTLFIMVTLGVVGAFLVTNRQWNEVKDFQQAINVRYTQAAQDIELLKKLEETKAENEHKAQLTTSLIEKVPRSILLAELINRMPDQMGLTEIVLESERVDKPRVNRSPRGAKSFSKSKKSKKGKDKEEDDAPKVRAPVMRTSLEIEGITPTHRDVAQYLKSLQECPLLAGVELVFSESAQYREADVFRFSINATLRSDIDARHIDPIERPRLIERNQAPEPGDLMNALGALFNPDNEQKER